MLFVVFEKMIEMTKNPTYEQVLNAESIFQQHRYIIDTVIKSNAKKNVEVFQHKMIMKRGREEENVIFDELAELLVGCKRGKM